MSLLDEIGYKIIGYSYDAGSQDLRLVGKKKDSTVEVIIHNPTKETIMSIMRAYDSKSPETHFDIFLIEKS